MTPEVRGSGREEDGDSFSAFDEVDAVLPADRVRPRAPSDRTEFSFETLNSSRASKSTAP
jgi:hypothetical protein